MVPSEEQKIEVEDRLFGVDPSTLDFVEDRGMDACLSE
jgi:hypothetical protein